MTHGENKYYYNCSVEKVCFAGTTIHSPFNEHINTAHNNSEVS